MNNQNILDQRYIADPSSQSETLWETLGENGHSVFFSSSIKKLMPAPSIKSLMNSLALLQEIKGKFLDNLPGNEIHWQDAWDVHQAILQEAKLLYPETFKNFI